MRRRLVINTLKLLLAVAIVAAVGRRFYQDLHDIDLTRVTLRPGWLALAGLVYLVGLAFSAVWWQRLLRTCGQKPALAATVRAYYIGQLGKYVPGKAWAVLLRSAFIRGPEVRIGIAAATGFYEVLATMGSGAFIAVIIFIIQPPSAGDLPWRPISIALLLGGLVAVPLAPTVLNRLVARLASRFQIVESFQLPPLKVTDFVEGMAFTSGSWIFLGAGLWASLQGVIPEPPSLSLYLALQCIGSLALAYVAGFLAIVLPGGVGAREYILLRLLAPLAPEAHIAMAVLVLRVVWTAADVFIAFALYWLPTRDRPISSPT